MDNILPFLGLYWPFLLIAFVVFVNILDSSSYYVGSFTGSLVLALLVIIAFYSVQEPLYPVPSTFSLSSGLTSLMWVACIWLVGSIIGAWAFWIRLCMRAREHIANAATYTRSDFTSACIVALLSNDELKPRSKQFSFEELVSFEGLDANSLCRKMALEREARFFLDRTNKRVPSMANGSSFYNVEDFLKKLDENISMSFPPKIKMYRGDVLTAAFSWPLTLIYESLSSVRMVVRAVIDKFSGVFDWVSVKLTGNIS